MKIDLKLPESKLPAAFPHPASKWTTEQCLNQIHSRGGKGLRYAIGSDGPSSSAAVSKSSATKTARGPPIYFDRDLGMFQIINKVWENHWTLRTKPEDWWFPVARLIAMAIDDAAKKEDERRKNSSVDKNDEDSSKYPVRSFFVSHQGKVTLPVDQNVYTIYQADYESLFASFASLIAENIRVPEFAALMQTSTFSTSTQTTQIVSQINLMAATKQFFSYEMGLCGCGIAGVEMMGQESDWKELVNKIRSLRALLKPIMPSIRWDVGEDWFNHVEYVFENLAKTYSQAAVNHGPSETTVGRDEWQPASTEVADFWANIFMISDEWKYGPSGFGGSQVKAYNGWLIQFLSGGRKSYLVEELYEEEVQAKLSGLNKVPMQVKMKWCNPPIEDEAEVVAGIVGYTLENPSTRMTTTSPGDDAGHSRRLGQVPILEPNHAWGMMLAPNSPLRGPCK